MVTPLWDTPMFAITVRECCDWCISKWGHELDAGDEDSASPIGDYKPCGSDDLKRLHGPL